MEGGETYNKAVKLVDVKILISRVEMEEDEEGYMLPDVPLSIRWDELKEGGVDLGPRGTLVVGTPQSEDRTVCNLRKMGHLAVQVQRTKKGSEFSRVLFNQKQNLYLLQRLPSLFLP